jgi:proline racemase
MLTKAEAFIRRDPMSPTLRNSIWTIDSHTAGEGTRLVTQGLPPLQGQTMGEKMEYAQKSIPWAPGALLLEPRGHKDLYGAILTPPCNPEADFGVVFMNNQGYEPMCGHGLIGVVTSLLEMGMLPGIEPKTELKADTPAGLIDIQVQFQNGRALMVAFENVPSFAVALDVPLDLENGYTINADVAFGGNFFALVRSDQLDLDLTIENTARLTETGMLALQAANQKVRIVHPHMSYLNRITDLRFYTDSRTPGIDSQNLVILGDRMVDRSPCGTGTCAELAVRYARHMIGLGEAFVTQGILGTHFRATAICEASQSPGEFPYPAIIPRLEGQAYLTGTHEFFYLEDDPFKTGFLIST